MANHHWKNTIQAIFNNSRESFFLSLNVWYSFQFAGAMCANAAFQQSQSQSITVTNWYYSPNNTVQLCTHTHLLIGTAARQLGSLLLLLLLSELPMPFGFGLLHLGHHHSHDLPVLPGLLSSVVLNDHRQRNHHDIRPGDSTTTAQLRSPVKL